MCDKLIRWIPLKKKLRPKYIITEDLVFESNGIENFTFSTE